MELKTYEIKRKINSIYIDTEILVIKAESEEKARELALKPNCGYEDVTTEFSEFIMYEQDNDNTVFGLSSTVDIYSIEEQND